MIHPDRLHPPAEDSVTLLCTGDIILDVPEPGYWLAGIASALQQADLAIGHLEVPHTHNSAENTTDVPAPGADPEHLAALKAAGFNLMTLAGNHVADCGAAGITDTIAGLDALGIAHCGAGPDLAAARRPAVLQAKGRRIAVLSYNCVGPESSWADEGRAGCAWLPMLTANGAPVAPAQVLSGPAAACRSILEADIAAARAEAKLVLVALHKGIVHTPAVIAAYEFSVAHLAIDAGADLVISHHSHIVRGIEHYRGKTIYHGLGNGCVVTRALDPGQAHPQRAAWARRRKELFGFEPDPAYTLAPFHPQAVNAFMARIDWLADGSLQAGLVPVHVDPPGRPRLADTAESRRIADYVAEITLAAGLPALNLESREGRLVL